MSISPLLIVYRVMGLHLKFAKLGFNKNSQILLHGCRFFFWLVSEQKPPEQCLGNPLAGFL